MKSLKEVCEGIWKLEDEFSLLDFSLDGINVWQSGRVGMYFSLAKATGVFSDPHPRSHLSTQAKLAQFFSGLFLKNPFLDFSPCEIMVVDHERKVLVDGEYIDIYSHYLIADLLKEGKSVAVYEFPYLNQHWTKGSSYRRSMDVFVSALKMGRFMRPKVSAAQEEFINKVNGRINEVFGVTFDLMNFFLWQWRTVKIESALFRTLIRNKRPQKIYTVVGYGHPGLVKAAKSLNVPVIELQHGTYSDYHMGYNFPGRTKPVEYFPNKLLVWADFWTQMAHLPIPQEDIEVYPFRYMLEKKKSFGGIKKIENQVIIISQGALGEKIAAEILKMRSSLIDMKIIYRLHPSEFHVWKNYPSVVELSGWENVKMIDNSEISLYKQLAESKYLIGVFSTAIYEALDFDCEIFLLDLPGIEYMSKLIEQKKARMISQKDYGFLKLAKQGSHVT